MKHLHLHPADRQFFDAFNRERQPAQCRDVADAVSPTEDALPHFGVDVCREHQRRHRAQTLVVTECRIHVRESVREDGGGARRRCQYGGCVPARVATQHPVDGIPKSIEGPFRVRTVRDDVVVAPGPCRRFHDHEQRTTFGSEIGQQPGVPLRHQPVDGGVVNAVKSGAVVRIQHERCKMLVLLL